MPSSRSYWSLSTRPLHVLVFLLPLILLYEVGTVRYLTKAGMVETIGAQSILYGFFATFGSWSTYLPGLALAAVLLIWHFLVADKWKVSGSTLLGMLLESAVLTLPLLVMGLLILGDRTTPAMGFQSPTSGPEIAADQLKQLPIAAKLTLSVGAGIYEELLFRLIALTGLHFLLVDIFKMPHLSGSIVAAAVSAVAFAFYHHHTLPNGALDTPLLMFYSLAGAYFAAIFLVRGFGVVVATHALYDMVALIVLKSK